MPGDRGGAVRRLRRALDETEIAGIQTTLPFHRFVARDTRRSSPASCRPAGWGTGGTVRPSSPGPSARLSWRPASTRSAHGLATAPRSAAHRRDRRSGRWARHAAAAAATGPMAAVSEAGAPGATAMPTRPAARIVDPRAVRVGMAAVARTRAGRGDRHRAARGPAGAGSARRGRRRPGRRRRAGARDRGPWPSDDGGIAIVDGRALRVRLDRLDGVHAPARRGHERRPARDRRPAARRSNGRPARRPASSGARSSSTAGGSRSRSSRSVGRRSASEPAAAARRPPMAARPRFGPSFRDGSCQSRWCRAIRSRPASNSWWWRR